MDKKSDKKISDASLKKETNLGLTPITVGSVKSPVKVYTSNMGRSRVPSLRWELSEWDLAEIGRIYDTDSYFRRACKVRKNLFLKEGYNFISANSVRSNYINARFRQIERATGIPTPVLFGTLVDSLGRLSNSYWVKVRDYKASGGKIRYSENGKQILPIAGYYPLPAETVQVKRDEYGRVKKYRQEIRGKQHVDFDPEDIIHFCFNKREGFSIGTPDIIPVKDDIRALRRVEENVELLIYQHLFPLFHHIIGTESAPATIKPDGTDEVQEAIYQIAHMPSDGCWVTSERHEIKAIGAASPPIDVDKVLAHLKQRIFTGLGVSPIDMGEGGTANKSTAQTLSRNLIDDTKANQKELGAQFFLYVIVELLEESTFSQTTLFDEENLVFLKFNEIDLEARQAKENHLMDMFLKNGITHPELRTEMGYKPFDGDGWPTGTRKSQMFTKGQGDWSQTNYGLIERDKIILQALDEPGTDVSKSESSSRTKLNKAKSSSSNGSISNKNQPSNQHGTRSSTKINKDFVKHVEESTLDEFKNSLLEDILFSFREGIRSIDKEIWNYNLIKRDYEIKEHFSFVFNIFTRDLSNALKRNSNKSNSLTYLVYKDLLLRLIKDESYRAFIYGQIIANLDSNKVLEINFLYQKDEKNEVFLKIKNTDAIIYRELPPIYPYTDFQMEVIFKEKDD